MDETLVKISRLAKKQLAKVPKYVVKTLQAWVESVQTDGIREVRKIPGFHDESLKGKRVGQRSIRLTRSYRAIYVVKKDGHIEFISVEEVTKHDY